MKKTFFSALFAACGALMLAAMPSLAAPRQYVIFVAEGVSPQVLDLGKSYERSINNDPAQSTAFDALMDTGKMAPIGADPLAQMKGLLSTAHQNGFKTGLVTTGDVTAIAPLFYDREGDTATALASAGAQYDFLGGGGRASLGETGAKVAAMGGTYLSNADEMTGDIKGRVLAAESEGNLNYALDRDPASESGLAELASLAMDTLSDAPYVLVVHDGLTKKALAARDTPALLEQFRELELIAADALSRRDNNPDLGVAFVTTGTQTVPQFAAGTSQADQNNAFFVVSNLGSSFSGAQTKLQGADVETITAFADANDGQYRAWNISALDKGKIARGELDPETALRASYEPVLKLEYAPQTVAPMAYTVGIDAAQGLIPALQSAVSTPAK